MPFDAVIGFAWSRLEIPSELSSVRNPEWRMTGDPFALTVPGDDERGLDLVGEAEDSSRSAISGGGALREGELVSLSLKDPWIPVRALHSGTCSIVASSNASTYGSAEIS